MFPIYVNLVQLLNPSLHIYWQDCSVPIVMNRTHKPELKLKKHTTLHYSYL